MAKVASGEPIDVGQLAELVAGSDGTNTVFLKVNSDGSLALIPGTGATSLGKAEDAAHASGDVGVMMLGVRNTALSQPTSTDGDYIFVGVSKYGSVLTSPVSGSGYSSDGVSAVMGLYQGAGSETIGLLGIGSSAFNGATWDRQRNNAEGTALALAARTTTTASADQVNYNGKLVVVIVNVTVWTADAITPAIQGKDPISGNYFQLHANFTAISATGTYVYVVGLSTLTAAAGGITAVAQAPVPRTWRVNMTHAGATTTTYSVAAITLL